MRNLVASVAALAIMCGVAGAALAGEPADPLARLQPLDATQLHNTQGGFIGIGIVEALPIIVVVIGFLGGDSGGQTQIDPPSLTLTSGSEVAGLVHDGLRSAFRETDFDFVSRAALRHAYKAQWSQ